MHNLSTAEMLDLYTSLKAGSLQKNWNEVWDNDEQFALMEENLDDLIYFATLAMPFPDQAAMEQFVGKLTIAKIMLEFVKENEGNVNQFITVGRSLENTIKNMLFSSPVVEKTLASLQKVSSFEELLGEDPQPAVANPLFMFLTSLMLLSNECIEEEEEGGCCDSEEACS